jgi:hypothetical protein
LFFIYLFCSSALTVDFILQVQATIFFKKCHCFLMCSFNMHTGSGEVCPPLYRNRIHSMPSFLCNINELGPFAQRYVYTCRDAKQIACLKPVKRLRMVRVLPIVHTILLSRTGAPVSGHSGLFTLIVEVNKKYQRRSSEL